MRAPEQHSWKKHIYNTKMDYMNSLPDRLRRLSSEKSSSPVQSLTSSNQKFRKNVINLQQKAVHELSFCDKIKEINQPIANLSQKDANKGKRERKVKNKQIAAEASLPASQDPIVEPTPPSPKATKGRNKRAGRKKQPVDEFMKSVISEEPVDMNLTGQYRPETKTSASSQANV